ncbi:MHYT domain-containing protein [Azospirillum baldaniorum]|uniref:MHYT domain-containing protein n=1 Tax=Azospirillum baldaniorum TaxID=1064539 RepID=UPI001FCBE097|nr:MHYT domain-containing protein [Azospirillum baldaniorum]
MLGHYDPYLVALSIVVASFGGYVALDLASHARDAGRGRNGWLGAAALALGAGIWSMHFIGMMAMRMPVPVSYDILLTALSFLLAVGVSGTGLFAVAHGGGGRATLAAAGLLTGFGIVSMHYVGMAGMRLPVPLIYDTLLVVASVVIAVAASTAALWLAFRTASPLQRLSGALVLGAAVVSMHYIGMAAANADVTAIGHAANTGAVPTGDDLGFVLSTPSLAVGTGVGTLLILSLGLLSVLIDRRRSAERAAGQEARYRAVVDSAVDPIVVIDETGTIQSFNRAAETTFGYGTEEAVGANVRILMAEPHHSAHDGYMAHFRETGERRIIGIGREVEGRRKDGSLFPLELSVAEWHDGRQRLFTGIMRDITARKAAEDALHRAKAEAERAREEALAARDKAERADMAKTKFLAAASHDLRQPVQSLFFFAHCPVRPARRPSRLAPAGEHERVAERPAHAAGQPAGRVAARCRGGHPRGGRSSRWVPCCSVWPTNTGAARRRWGSPCATSPPTAGRAATRRWSSASCAISWRTPSATRRAGGS